MKKYGLAIGEAGLEFSNKKEMLEVLDKLLDCTFVEFDYSFKRLRFSETPKITILITETAGDDYDAAFKSE